MFSCEAQTVGNIIFMLVLILYLLFCAVFVTSSCVRMRNDVLVLMDTLEMPQVALEGPEAEELRMHAQFVKRFVKLLSMGEEMGVSIFGLLITPNIFKGILTLMLPIASIFYGTRK